MYKPLSWAGKGCVEPSVSLKLIVSKNYFFIDNFIAEDLSFSNYIANCCVFTVQKGYCYEKTLKFILPNHS